MRAWPDARMEGMEWCAVLRRGMRKTAEAIEKIEAIRYLRSTEPWDCQCGGLNSAFLLSAGVVLYG